MCGIVGTASGTLPVDADLLTRMRDSMCHRGPDSAGSWISPNGLVGLGHRRLAIIDLSPSGHQPMSDHSGRLHLTFNGEIYNYVELKRELRSRGSDFNSTSDTEVILEAYRTWGLNCLQHFNGMFAFCLYDEDNRRLFLARDRAGEKPLYYQQRAGKLTFASELKAFFTDPDFSRQIDHGSLYSYLAYGYVMGGGCMLAGVAKLPQAHAMTYDIENDALRVWHYWNLPEFSPGAADAGELAEELEALLFDSVRLRMIADVPVGVMLSGGIDSSLVAAIASKVSATRVKTFTVSFPGHGATNEARFAQSVARHLDTEHYELPASAISVDLLPKLAGMSDEPGPDHSIVPTYVLCQLLRQSVKVALGGDGGDELFGGYPHYNWLATLDPVRQILPIALRRAAAAGAARWMPVGMRGRNHLIGMASDADESVAATNLLFDRECREQLLPGHLRNRHAVASSPEEHKRGLSRLESSSLRKATAVDFQTYLVDDILTKVDRASMLNSLEVRTPMLDHRIIEFAFGRLPDLLRVSVRRRKILLKQLAKRHLPRDFDLKRKQGFCLPLNTWFKGDWGDFVEGVLSDTDQIIFDRKVVASLIAGQRRGLSNAARLFALVMFELWRRHFRLIL